MPKFSTAAAGVPLLVTVACDPAASVVTDPTATAAAAPGVPAAPVGPAPPACAITLQVCGAASGSRFWFALLARYVDPSNVTASSTAEFEAEFHAPRKFIPTAPVVPAGPAAPVGPAIPCNPCAPI